MKQEQEIKAVGGRYCKMPTASAQTEILSNFTMENIYRFVLPDQVSYRVIEFTNYLGQSFIEAVDSRLFLSNKRFKTFVAKRGSFVWNGSKDDLFEVCLQLQKEDKEVIPLKTSGWNQKHNVFAWANGIYSILDQKFIPSDKHGIASFNHDRRFLIAAHHKHPSYNCGETSFEDWSKLYCKVYGEAGEIAIVFFAMCLFSDIIFKETFSFPMLFVHGARGAGKTSLVDGILSLYNEQGNTVELTSFSTPVGILRHFSYIINGVVHLDTYQNDLPETLQTLIKDIYNRHGLERGGTPKQYMPLPSGCIITGQEAPDEPALFSRCINLELPVKNHCDHESYNSLLKMQRSGLSQIITGLLKHRDFFAKCFKDNYERDVHMLRDILNPCPQDRLILNYAMMTATVSLLRCIVLLPFETTAFRSRIISRLKEHDNQLDFLIQQSDQD